MTDGADLIEVIPVMDVYVDGVGMAETLTGGNCRVTYFVYQHVLGHQGFQRVIAARIVRPRQSLIVGAVSSMLEAWPEKPTIDYG